MQVIARLAQAMCGAALALAASAVGAQGFPGQKEGTYIARDFRFHTGQAKWWAQELSAFLASTPRRSP